MGAYEYTALDAAGREKKGVLEGDTAKHVRQLLRERELLPVTVTEAAREEARRQRKFGIARGASATDLALLTRQLATLSKAGLPLEEALLAVSQQTEKPRVQSILLGVRSRVMEGHTLASGFAEFPRVFPEIYRATVSAGEQSGHLDEVLERLADYTEGRELTRQKVLGAMLYPIVLTVMCFGIVTGLLVYVVPKVIEVFDTGKAQLPLMTRILIGVSDFLQTWGLWLLAGLVVVIVGVGRWLRNPEARRRYHEFQLRLPLVGQLVRGFNTARFTRTLSILTAAAVPVLEALRIAGEVVTNIPMKNAVVEAGQRVREGAPIGRSLAQSKLFPPMTIHLISSGESSGKLETMLERAAVSQERELDGILAALVGLLGPLLIVVMGLFVMGIVFAMLLPIFEMNALIR
ncbi:MAG TPA: type II secretion system inner membrane protein GspF [Steroidobacteraceae bacterium]|nr:type II secretion system inner membrane protein GspF [Steroidobacteraceae bacterium]HQZ80867.1 type II secretion system inner membrane protein GspF [Steroidobacteraceae bacterium]